MNNNDLKGMLRLTAALCLAVIILGAYDLRLHAPSITLKYDILQWQ